MVKTPKMRHSTPARDPKTIDLEPGDVARVEQEAANTPEAMSETEATAFDDSTETGRTTSREQEFEATSAASAAATSERKDERAAYSASTSSNWGQPPARSRGSLSRILAGIVGAVVALILAGLLQYFGVLSRPGEGGGGGVAQTDFDALKQQVATMAASDAASRIDALSTSLEAVKADVAALKQAPAAGDPAAMQALDARVEAVEAALKTAGSGSAPAAPADLQAIGERIAAVEAAVKAASDAAASGNERIATLEQSVATITGKMDAAVAQPKIALAIATAALKSAVERGATFSAELETLAAIAPGLADIEALRAHAAAGVPSNETLVQQVDAAAAAMIAAGEPVAEDAGFFDRLLQSAEQLVTVRPIGTVEGTSVAAIVARMEVALKSGDIATAGAEFDSLPEPVKAAAGTFGTGLKARQEVDALLARAIADAMKA